MTRGRGADGEPVARTRAGEVARVSGFSFGMQAALRQVGMGFSMFQCSGKPAAEVSTTVAAGHQREFVVLQYYSTSELLSLPN